MIIQHAKQRPKQAATDSKGRSCQLTSVGHQPARSLSASVVDTQSSCLSLTGTLGCAEDRSYLPTQYVAGDSYRARQLKGVDVQAILTSHTLCTASRPVLRVGGGAIFSPYDAALSGADTCHHEEAKSRLDSYNLAYGSHSDQRDKALTGSEQHLMGALQFDDVSKVQQVSFATNITKKVCCLYICWS